MTKNKIIIISGATATGKTDISLQASSIFPNLEIVNFDSLLFYKELNIGTAKPSLKEREQTKHHLIDICSVKEPVDAAKYHELALPKVHQLHSLNKTPVLVGGSGFYLQALINGMFPSISTPKKVLDQSQDLFKQKGISPFIKILKDNDPINFKKLHENDHYRIIRAVEHFWTTGTPFSLAKDKLDKNIKKNYQKFNWEILHIYLEIPKLTHWDIIERRTKTMIQNGLIEEVEELLNKGYSLYKPLHSIGYKETIQFLNEKEMTIDQLQQKVTISTRQLAKSQKTWFKTKEKTVFNPLLDRDRILNEIKEFYEH